MATQLASGRQRSIEVGGVKEPIDVQKLREYLFDLYSFAGLRPVFSTVQTTDATLTTLQTVLLAASTEYHVEARVIGKRIGGVSGVDTDSAGYVRRATFKRLSTGGAVLVGAVQDNYTSEDQTAWDCTLAVSGNNVLLQITGAAGNTIRWSGIVTILQV